MVLLVNKKTGDFLKFLRNIVWKAFASFKEYNTYLTIMDLIRNPIANYEDNEMVVVCC